MSLKLLLLATFGACAAACSDSSGGSADGGDAATNPPVDSGNPAPGDATTDASPPADSSVDAPVSPNDSGAPDTSVDAPAPPSDGSAGDASADAGPTDAAADGNADGGVTGSNWMGAIGDSTSLAALSIPGTHDTGATHESAPGTLKTQDLSVPDQLAAGVRYFDIRVENLANKFEVFHTTLDQNLSFDTVLQDVSTFFAANPGETLILCLKEEQPASGSTNTFEQTFQSYVAQNASRWYLSASVPTLGQVRGKIVLLRRFSVTTLPTGIDATVWADNTTFTISNADANLRIQDYYEIPDDDSKWTSITSLFTEALSGSGPTLYLNNTSAYFPLDGGVENIPGVSDVINAKLVTYFTGAAKGRYGVVAMDFADTAKSSLVFATNFK
ncbi:MAG TPA: phosphatidylinositol-specific phospholipase C domain-containing protein [Polyangiaceae bacterium]